MVKHFIITILLLQALTLFSQTKLDSLNNNLHSCADDDCRVSSLMDLADYYYKKHNSDSLEGCFNKIRAVEERVLLNPEIDTVLFELFIDVNKSITGYYLNVKGQYQIAMVYYNLSIKFAKLIGSNYQLANQYHRIGIANQLMGDYEIAILNERKAISLYLLDEDVAHAANAYIEIANIYKNWGQLEEAEINYRKSLEIYIKIDDSLGISAASIGIGNVLKDQRQFNEALVYYKKSYEIEKQLSNPDGIVLALLNISGIYYINGDNELALEYSFKALEKSKQYNRKFRRATILSQIGSIYINLHEYKKAESYLKESLSLARELNFKQAEQESLKSLSDLYAKTHDYKKAYDYANLYHITKDSIFNAEKFKELSTLEVKYKTAEKDKKILLQEKEIETSNLKFHQERVIRNIFIAGVSIALLFSIYIFIMYRQKQKANHLLAKQKSEIEEQRDNIQNQKLIIEKIHQQVSESIDYAMRLQRSILPDHQVLSNIFKDHFVLFKPKDKVSGDFYWWHSIGDSTIITAADCTGHGVPGAFMSVLGVTFLREIIIKTGILQPNLILNQLRNEIINALDQKGRGGMQKDGMDMALINVSQSSRLLQYAGAYNSLYIIRAGEEKEIKTLSGESLNPIAEMDKHLLFELKADKMPIGIYQRMDDFSLYEVLLSAGDRIFMFSDGFADQFGGPKGKKFKYKAFRNLLLTTAAQNMGQQKEALELAFAEWKGDNHQIDDIVVLGIEIS